jgi:hypothetical protein
MGTTINVGDELTIDHEIINDAGQISFTKGQKVIIREIWKDEGHWSNVYDMWIETKIHGVKLEDHYGIMFLNCFKETKK